MAYTDDAVLAKLSALNESHESIASAAQWIMFHRYAIALFNENSSLFDASVYSFIIPGAMQIGRWHYGIQGSRTHPALSV